MKKDEQRLRDLCKTMKSSTLHKMEVPEGEERKGQKKKYLKKNAWKQPKFDERHKYMHPRISTVPSRINSKTAIPQNLIIKLLKVKDQERILKAAREVTHYVQRILNIINNFSSETIESRG